MQRSRVFLALLHIFGFGSIHGELPPIVGEHPASVPDASQLDAFSEPGSDEEMPFDLQSLFGLQGSPDQDQLFALLSGEGGDPAALQELFGSLRPEAPLIQIPRVPDSSFGSVLERYKREQVRPSRSPIERELGIEGTESAVVLPLQSGEIKLLEKFTSFVSTQLANRNKRTAYLIYYILYRQATWIWRKWWQETKPMWQRLPSSTLLDGVLGIKEFPHKIGSVPTPFFWFFDLSFRSVFSAAHLWVGLRTWFDEAKWLLESPHCTQEMQAQHLHRLTIHLTSAYSFFTNPTYYGASLPWAQGALVELALPFAYSLWMRDQPFTHKIFARSTLSCLSATVQRVGLEGEALFNEKVSSTTRAKIFDRTLGIVRPRTILEVSRLVSMAAQALVLGSTYPLKEKMTQYVIRLVYLYVVIGLLREGCRQGAVQWIYRLASAVCEKLIKLGVIGSNPLETLQQRIVQRLADLGALKNGAPLHEVMASAAYVFPAAFVRAIKQKMTKQDLPAATRRAPQFVDAMGKLDRLSLLDPLVLAMQDPGHFIKELGGSVAVLQRGLAPEKREEIMTAFFNEVVAELCFNRDLFTCQWFTEAIVTSWLGNKAILAGCQMVLV